MRKIVFVIAVAAFLAAACDRHEVQHDVSWNNYAGTLRTALATYRAEIDDADLGAGFERIAHLYPQGENVPLFASITGHDYNTDGRWDVVIYCAYQIAPDGFPTGCNSVKRPVSGEGEWEFVPCKTDESRGVAPFTSAEIEFAVSELDAGMKAIHNSSGLWQAWDWDQRLSRMAMTYQRPPKR